MTCLETQYPPIVVTTPASELPVSVDDVRAYCDYEDNDRNGQFVSWIKAAAALVEHDCEVALCSQTCTLYLPWFLDTIELRKPPVASVSSITYLDADGASQTLATSVYAVNTKRWPPRIRLADGQSWPTTQDYTDNAVTITFVAGFGASSTDPKWALYQEAVRVKVKRMYDGCGDGKDMVYDSLIGALRWRPFV